MIEDLKNAAKVAWREGRERDVFITIEVEPAGVLVRCASERTSVRRAVTWAQIETKPTLLIETVGEVAGHFPLLSEVA